MMAMTNDIPQQIARLGETSDRNRTSSDLERFSTREPTRRNKKKKLFGPTEREMGEKKVPLLGEIINVVNAELMIRT